MSCTHGVIDLTIRATTKREREVLDAIRRRPGMFLQRVHRDGPALRLVGPGVHVVVADLRSLTPDDLEPAKV